jgi:hypothetical protein
MEGIEEFYFLNLKVISEDLQHLIISAMKNKNRREFLKKSILGISGAALVPGTLKAYPAYASLNVPPDLPVRPLGKTGIRTPLISFGTSGALDTGFIRSAYEAGIKMFFSATYYGEGNNEKIVGKDLKGSPRFLCGRAAVPPDGFDNRQEFFPKLLIRMHILKKLKEA